MNHCVDCLHWDEDSIDQEGHGDCSNKDLRNNFRQLFPAYKLNLFMRPRGDDTCSMFTPKQTVGSKRP